MHPQHKHAFLLCFNLFATTMQISFCLPSPDARLLKNKRMCAVKEKGMVIYEWIIRSGLWPSIWFYFTQSETSSWDLQFSFLQRIICIREANLQGCVGVAKYVPLGLISANSFATGDLTQGLVYDLQVIFLAILVDTNGISPVTAFDSDHQYLLWESILDRKSVV